MHGYIWDDMTTIEICENYPELFYLQVTAGYSSKVLMGGYTATSGAGGSVLEHGLCCPTSKSAAR